ncbi:MAG: helix-turn-helix transcriptional regulator [Phycisphaeraceae bacterium]|nr:helix-turn-helix transcriptional regulator [Phycisphaeraceae bacterium]
MTTQTPTGLPDHLTEDQRRRLRWIMFETRIEVTTAIWWQVRRGWSMKPRRQTDDFLFIPMTHGLDAQVQERSQRIAPGQCLLARTGESHSAKMIPACEQMQVVSLHANILPQWGGRLDQLIDDPFPSLPDLTASENRLARLVHLMHVEPDTGKKLGESLIRDWLIFWTLERSDSAGNARTRVDPRVVQAAAIMHDRFQQPLTVEQLADEVRLRPVQFRKLFRQAYGQSPKAYLAQYRLRQAASQLRISAASVKEIAYATGFADEHYFHLAFRRHFRCTPGEHRRHSREMV